MGRSRGRREEGGGRREEGGGRREEGGGRREEGGGRREEGGGRREEGGGRREEGGGRREEGGGRREGKPSSDSVRNLRILRSRADHVLITDSLRTCDNWCRYHHIIEHSSLEPSSFSGWHYCNPPQIPYLDIDSTSRASSFSVLPGSSPPQIQYLDKESISQPSSFSVLLGSSPPGGLTLSLNGRCASNLNIEFEKLKCLSALNLKNKMK